ncbi:MAG: hypothetical protein LBQ21_03730 [Clostridiales Family XIII bacterium]|jgi:hypothetical protein|nr:hypothetical protein [Clostridiales Family XIII bacterium]
MLGKLIKYEFKATAKLFLLAYVALAVVALLNLVLFPLAVGDNPVGETLRAGTGIVPGGDSAVLNVAGVLTMVLYVLSAIGLIVVTFVVVIIRFYRNLLGDEGYLMFTLPVTISRQILSKLIVGTLWTVCSIAIVFVTFLVLLIRLDALEAVNDTLRTLSETGYPVGLWIASIVFTIILSALSGILQFYAAMAVGPRITDSRLGGSIVAYIVIYIITQVVTFAILLIFALISNLELFAQSAAENLTSVSAQAQLFDSVGFVILGSSVVSCVAIGTACYIFTHRMLKRNLNLG